MHNSAFHTVLPTLLFTLAAGVLSAQSRTLAPGTSIPVNECHNLSLRGADNGRLELQARTATATCLMGYTDEPTPTDIEMPDNMRYWLQCVQQATQHVQSNPSLQLGTASASASTSPIQPLLGDIKWDQTYPYNMYCPKNTPVGCVATAAAQVMYYYRYPEQGIGEYSYTQSGTKHHVNFGETHYKWDLMFDSYNRYQCTTEQAKAVAELSYHVGVAVDMQYNSGGSGTWTEFLPSVLHRHFGYNSHTSSAYRKNYSFAGWNEVIQNELREGRPVVFAANDGQYGHCFVLDGVNEQGLYHVNWGWSGYYNGYFDINILNPEGSGTGGGHSNYGYCFDQTCLVNFCPEEGVGQKLSPVDVDNPVIQLYEQYLYHGMFYSNSTKDTLSVVPVLQLRHTADQECYSFEGDTLMLYPYATSDRRNSRYYYAWAGIDVYSNDLADGDYELTRYCKIIQAEGDTLYEQPISYYDGGLTFVSVQDQQFLGADIEQQGPDFKLSEFSLQDEELAVSKNYTANIQIQNTGSDQFFGQAILALYQEGMNQPLTFDDNNEFICIEAGQTYKARFPINIDREGEWEGFVYLYDRTTSREYYIENEEQPIAFTAKRAEDIPYNLNLVMAPRLLTSHCTEGGEASFRLTIANNGMDFANRLAMIFYTEQSRSSEPVLTLSQEFQIKKGAQRDMVTLEGTLDGLEAGQTYYAWPYYMNDEQEYKMLFRNGVVVAAIEVTVYPTEGIQQITVDPAADMPAYDLLGRPVPADQRNRGSLLIRGRQILCR